MRSRSSGRQRLDVEAGREPLDEREDHLHVAQVGLDRLGDARVLDLDRDGLALGRRSRGGPGRSRRPRTPLPRSSSKTSASGSPSSSLSSFSTLLEGQRRDVVAQRRERRLELLALGLGDRGEVDGREDLADLHRRAAHLAELLDELARGRGGALAGRGVGASRRCAACWRRACRPSAGPGRRRGRRSGGCGRCGMSEGSRPLTQRTEAEISETILTDRLSRYIVDASE